jgi:hypothetical protein
LPEALLTATTATFSTLGTYILSLKADDGELIGVDSVTVTVNGPSGEIAIDTTISYPDDDAEERANHTTKLTDSLLELTRYDSAPAGNQTVGLRFRDLAIPPGAAIQRAHIQFTVGSATSEDTSLTLRGQDVDNAPIFAATNNNISQRTTTASVSGHQYLDTVNAAGVDQQTPDLKAIVQSIVNRPGWVSGNAMVFIITGTGQRVAKATAGELKGAPHLHIEYLTTENQAITVTTAPSTAGTSPGGGNGGGWFHHVPACQAERSASITMRALGTSRSTQPGRQCNYRAPVTRTHRAKANE